MPRTFSMLIRRLGSGVLIFSYLNTLVSAASPPAKFLDQLEHGHPQIIVVYGTSLTANAAWPSGLQKILRHHYGTKVRMVNAALGGKDSRWGLAHLNERVIREQPNAVFIEFTINDALEASMLSVTESTHHLKSMIQQVRLAEPNCEIILMVMNPPTAAELEKRRNFTSYRKAYQTVARDLKCRLIDFYPLWKSLMDEQPERWQNYAPDGLHPNNLASREVILPALLEGLGCHANPKALENINRPNASPHR
ncbi:MAG: SGNH/GDSL hydrolase family protein [Akkermansiaceae bacterium]|nr:SGNH/GDSL hydrolase family protein [Akkermansiaceae bacterium]